MKQEPTTGCFTSVGKQVLANGVHYADFADDTAAKFATGALNKHGHETSVTDNWQPIDTAPKDGSYILLRFDGPFHDLESPGVAIGKAIDNGSGWWTTAIWASSTADKPPVAWSPLPTFVNQPRVPTEERVA